MGIDRYGYTHIVHGILGQTLVARVYHLSQLGLNVEVRVNFIYMPIRVSKVSHHPSQIVCLTII